VCRTQAVYEFHGADKTCFGGRATDVSKIYISGSRAEGSDDTSVEGYFCGEIGKMEVACIDVNELPGRKGSVAYQWLQVLDHCPF